MADTLPSTVVEDQAAQLNFEHLGEKFPLQSADIDDDAITAAHIAADSVGTSEIAANVITQSEVDTSFITSSTYNPTYTSVANLDATPTGQNPAFYFRVGSMVTVFGTVDVDVTVAATLTTFRISLPIASAIANPQELAGGVFGRTEARSGQVIGTAATDDATVNMSSDTTSSTTCTFTFGYRVI